MEENIGNRYVKISVKQEELEDSINGLEQLKPILQRIVISANGKDKKQAQIDAMELGKHFDTAITTMEMLLVQFPDYADAR